MIDFSRAHLVDGHISLMWKDTTFNYAYFLWFEDASVCHKFNSINAKLLIYVFIAGIAPPTKSISNGRVEKFAAAWNILWRFLPVSSTFTVSLLFICFTA